jgi:hypothetical protein
VVDLQLAFDKSIETTEKERLNMFDKSTNSKYLFANLRNGALLCTVLILLSCAQLSNSGQREKSETYGSSALQERIASGDYTAVILIDEKQKTSVFAAGGQDITTRYCGKIAEDGSIVDNEELPKEERCNLKGFDLLRVRNIQTYTIRQNPECMLVNWGPYLVKVHAGGDGFPQGAYPCHARH